MVRQSRLSAFLLVLSFCTGCFAQDTEPPQGNSEAAPGTATAVAPPKLTAAAKERLRAAFDKVRQEGDLAEWQKVDITKIPSESANLEDKIKFKRKLLEVLEFCQEERFQTLAAVDEMEFLSPSDKQTCKDRLKLINPLIE